MWEQPAYIPNDATVHHIGQDTEVIILDGVKADKARALFQAAKEAGWTNSNWFKIFLKNLKEMANEGELRFCMWFLGDYSFITVDELIAIHGDPEPASPIEEEQ
jgi:hypothetical protein